MEPADISTENKADERPAIQEVNVEKGVRQAFGSYGGKRALAHKIAAYIPYHKTYVEPFAGGAAVLFAKDPSPQEILNDRDSEIAFMYRFIRDHTFTWDGTLPLNTSGGQLSVGQAGAAGGFLGMVEALRQLTRQAEGRQVPDAKLALVSGFGMINFDRGLGSGAAILSC